MFKKIKDWFLIGIWLTISLILTWITYAAIATVTTWETLTASMWNEVADNSVKAYASFNWKTTVSIYEQSGVSSIVRDTAWLYTVTWSTPFANKFYRIQGSCSAAWTAWAHFTLEWNNITSDPYEGLNTTSAIIWCRDGQWNNIYKDSDLIHITVYWNQ